MTRRTTTPSAYDGLTVNEVQAIDFAVAYPEKWPRILACFEGNEGAARAHAANMLIGIHKPIFGPVTRTAHEKHENFREAFGVAFAWNAKRFLRSYRRPLKGKRAALRYWRAMTKGVRHGLRGGRPEGARP